jgi:uncharacterized protein (DUF697 family)
MSRLLAGLFSCALLLLSPRILATTLPADVTMEGGCPPESSPYLAKDTTVVGARITYCTGGDAWTGTLKLRIPTKRLVDHDVVIAGYPGQSGVRLVVRRDDAHGTELVVPQARESWLPLPMDQALRSGEGFLSVEIEDRSVDALGWAGLGIAPRQPPAQIITPDTARAAGIAAAVLFLSLLVATRWRRPAPGAYLSRVRIPVAVALLGLLTALALLFRRPSQFQFPALWVEEGTITLPQFLNNGIGFLFEPVAGYLILPSKILFYLATFAPSESFPLALAVLSVLFTWLVVCAIALCPSHLRAPVPVAAFLLLLPTDAENYASAHYAFWFGSALLVPVLFWKNGEPGRWWLRTLLIVLGGLSSPLVIALLPAFLVRLYRFRTRDEVLQVGLILATAAIQAMFLASSGTHGTTPPLQLDAVLLVGKFFGMFWAPNDAWALPFGLLLVAGMIVAILRRGRELPWLALAGYGLAATIAISVTRAPLEAIHPVLAGPRYFFYPYFFLGLIVIELGTGSRRTLAACFLLVMIGSLIRFIDVGSRTHEAIDWSAHLEACDGTDGSYAMPVHFDGASSRAWHVTLTNEECRRIREGWK